MASSVAVIRYLAYYFEHTLSEKGSEFEQTICDLEDERITIFGHKDFHRNVICQPH